VPCPKQKNKKTRREKQMEMEVGVMDIGEQSARRTALMEESSKVCFLSAITKRNGEIILLKKERGIPENACLCGRKIEPGRLQLNLPYCRVCAFEGQLCTSRQ
jgi:hypothetical protein